MEKNETGRTRCHAMRPRPQRKADNEILAQAHDGIVWAIGLPFALMFFMGVMLGW